MAGDDVMIFRGTTCQTVHLPTLAPASGTYTFRTGEPIRIEPGFQEVEITISLAPPKPNLSRCVASGWFKIGGRRGRGCAIPLEQLPATSRVGDRLIIGERLYEVHGVEHPDMNGHRGLLVRPVGKCNMRKNCDRGADTVLINGTLSCQEHFEEFEAWAADHE